MHLLAKITCSLCVIAVSQTATSVAVAQDTAFFIPASPENIRLHDGSALPKELEQINWEWHPDKGNKGILQSKAVAPGDQKILMLNADKLEAGAIYEVFGYFWADAPDIEGTDTQSHHPALLGLSLATLHPFDGETTEHQAKITPWVITPGSRVGEKYGYELTKEADSPLDNLKLKSTVTGSSQLMRARLGYSRAGKDGTLPVFFADYTNRQPEGTVRIDGIALRRASDDASIEQGFKEGTRIHMAVRAGDPVTLARELEAGSDVDALDEDGLTALFYASAATQPSLVETLLKYKADPNTPKQSAPPLMGAAMASSTDVTKMLLNAGAKIPPTPPDDCGLLKSKVETPYLHPVVAAIEAGSLPVLKLLMEKAPDLDIQSLYPPPVRPGRPSDKPSPDLIGKSWENKNWELAAYLVDNGISMLSSWSENSTRAPERMLAQVIMEYPDSKPLVEAMLRQGAPPVIEDYRGGSFPYMVMRDGLSAAASGGHADLVRRFLPLAKDTNENYQHDLLVSATYSGNEEVINMVKEHFPKVEYRRWKPNLSEEDNDSHSDTPLRLFLPRTSPPPATSDQTTQEGHVLAVIASPDASAPGDALSAIASQTNKWKVVDRELIESALKENLRVKPWQEGEHRLSDLGDKLAADSIIIVSAIKAEKAVVYRFEVIEVATGLEIHREHFKSDEFNLDMDLPDLLARSSQALQAARRNERHHAITLLSFSAHEERRDSLALSSLMRSTIQHEVDATPGLISLNRAQSSRLVEEQALQGLNSVWGAAHMIEGSITMDREGGMKAVLRLETIKDGKTLRTDAEASGKADSAPEVIKEAWGTLKIKAGDLLSTTRPAREDKVFADREAKRLLREASWLSTIMVDPDDIIPLVESASTLGAPVDELSSIHLELLFRKITSFNPHWKPDTGWKRFRKLPYFAQSAHWLPCTLTLSDQYCHQLPEARRLLQQTLWYLDGSADHYFEQKEINPNSTVTFQGQDFWMVIQILSYIRTTIYEDYIPEYRKLDYRFFCEELNDLTYRYFEVIRSIPNVDSSLYIMRHCDKRIYEKNPVLAESLAGMITTSASIPDLLPAYRSSLQPGVAYMAEKMASILDETNSPDLQHRKAILNIYLSDETTRQQAIRDMMDSLAILYGSNHENLDELIELSKLYYRLGIKDKTTSILFGIFYRLQNNASAIPSLLHHPRPAPDLYVRPTTYLNAHGDFPRMLSYKKQDSAPGLDPFRLKYSAHLRWEVERLKKLQPQGQTDNNKPRFTHDQPASDLVKFLKGIEPKKPEEEAPPQDHPTINAELLADLRINGKTGFTIWPIIDRSDPNILWLHSFQTIEGHMPIMLGSGAIRSSDHRCNSVWLVAIDCRTGEYVHKIDLSKASSYAGEPVREDLKFSAWDIAIAQTNDRILTKGFWGDKGRMRAIVIDKKSGSIYPLPDNVSLEEGSFPGMDILWLMKNAVVGLDEHFYFLSIGTERNGGLFEGNSKPMRCIFEVDPDNNVRPLTKIGRRPEQTPFDPIDRSPIGIIPYDDRLIVIDESVAGHYDPQTKKWEVKNNLKSVNDYILPFMDSLFWEHLRERHEIHLDGKDTGWMSISYNCGPGKFPMASRVKGFRNFNTTADFPEHFYEQTKLKLRDGKDEDGRDKFKESTFGEYIKSKKTTLTVIAQTNDDLILMMQLGNGYEWMRPTKNAAHAPILWKISKRELLQALEEHPENN